MLHLYCYLWLSSSSSSLELHLLALFYWPNWQSNCLPPSLAIVLRNLLLEFNSIIQFVCCGLNWQKWVDERKRGEGGEYSKNVRLSECECFFFLIFPCFCLRKLCKTRTGALSAFYCWLRSCLKSIFRCGFKYNKEWRCSSSDGGGSGGLISRWWIDDAHGNEKQKRTIVLEKKIKTKRYHFRRYCSLVCLHKLNGLNGSLLLRFKNKNKTASRWSFPKMFER